VYVTHLLQRNQARLWTLLESGAHVYVCGFGVLSALASLLCLLSDARRMATDVHHIFETLIAKHGNKSAAEAKDYLKAMTTRKRYQTDVWS
jgi:sulfite reductase alpha subunit-like flavoprotein